MNEIYLRSISGQSFRVEGEMKLGRDPSCQINIPDARISRIHATLQVKDNFLYVKDEGSSNGTYINGIRINKPTLLQHGDHLQVGSTKLKVEYIPVQEVAPESNEPAAETEVVAALANVVQPQKTTEKQAPPSTQHTELKPHVAYNPPPSSENEIYETLTNVPAPSKIAPNEQNIIFSMLSPSKLAKKENILPAVLLLAALLIGLSLLILPQIFPTETKKSGDTLPDSGAKEIFAVSPSGREIETKQGIRIIVPPHAVTENVIVEVLTEAHAPSLPAPLSALGNAIAIKAQNAPPLSFPLIIELPLPTDEPSTSTELAALRFQDDRWLFLGGIRIANTLRFSTDAFGLFQIVKLPQESQYLSFSPVLIINQGDAQAALSPWQWWQAPDNALSELMNVNHLITITKKEDASKEKGGSIAHLSLPFGVYSSWCVGWYNEQLGSIQYRIIPYQLSLTRYSCRWEDFLQGKCTLETIPITINSADEGSEKSCRK